MPYLFIGIDEPASRVKFIDNDIVEAGNANHVHVSYWYAMRLEMQIYVENGRISHCVFVFLKQIGEKLLL